jgi:O-antigen/teichoic acid export membrane protein
LNVGHHSVLLVEAYVIVLAITGLQVHRLQAEGRFGLATSIAILDRALIIVAALVLGFASGITADRARLIVLGAAAASLGLGLFARPPGLPRLEPARLLPMARFSASIALGVWMGTLFAWGDIAMASRWLSARDLGCYYLASQALAVLLQLSQVVGVVVGPLTISLIVGGQWERARQFFRRGSAQLCWLASVMLGLLIASTSILLPILIPNSYAATLEPLVFLIAAGATAPLYFFSLSIFNAYRRPDLITAATVVLGGSNLLLGLLFIPWYGATGAALAKGLSLGIGALYACRRSLQLLDVAWPPGLLLALTPALVAVGAVLWHPSQSGAIAAAALSIVAAAAALRYGRLFQPDDIGRLQSVGFPNWTRSMLQMALRVTS